MKIDKESKKPTQVTSKDTKNSSATWVYPHAAVFASIAALLFFIWLVDAILVGVGGTSNLGLRGTEWISTEYWSYPLLLTVEGDLLRIGLMAVVTGSLVLLT